MNAGREETHTGNYSVPAEIRAMKPRGTAVKKISGNYYVYELLSRKTSSGKWGTASGKCIGRIDEQLGFIRNDAFEEKPDITVLEYGQYACACYGSGNTRSVLERFFPGDEAERIYFLAMILYVNGYATVEEMAQYYAMSYLCMEYPELSMTEKSIWDTLGRNSGTVLELQEEMLRQGSGNFGVKKHAFSTMEGGPEQALFEVYDLESGLPVCFRFRTEDGKAPEWTGTEKHLWIADRKMSEDAAFRKTMESGKGRYVMERDPEEPWARDAVRSLEMPEENRFAVQTGNGKRHVRFGECTDDGKRLLVFLEDPGQERKIRTGRKKTEDPGNCGNRLKTIPKAGALVLETNTGETPEQLYRKYRKVADIPPPDFRGIACGQLDGMTEEGRQGLALVLQASAMIRQDMERASGEERTGAVREMLLHARSIKLQKARSRWKMTYADPASRKALRAFHVDAKKYGFTPPGDEPLRASS